MSEDRVPTGIEGFDNLIEGLDKMLNGGLFKGSVAMVVGASSLT